ncbi:MAG: flagellar type III secretion system pore protein FliP [Terracidiphilus sp.]
MRLFQAIRVSVMLISLSAAVLTPAKAQWGSRTPEAELPVQGASVGAGASTNVVPADGGLSGSRVVIPNTGMANALPTVPNGGALQIQGMPGGSVPWSIIIMLTALTLIPSVLMCVTPFARLLIVFHFLRQALGLQSTPSNQTLIGLSLTLTFFIMQPVALQIYQDAIIPMQAGQITAIEALNRGEGPMRKFMCHYVREKDVALFIELAKEPRPASPDDLSLRVLLPAYILSELKAGFQIGTVLFLPFLIVDMVVASITTSVGMLQLPPVVISTPLKLLLFLMVDGWHLLISSLMRSFS